MHVIQSRLINLSNVAAARPAGGGCATGMKLAHVAAQPRSRVVQGCRRSTADLDQQPAVVLSDLNEGSFQARPLGASCATDST